MDRFAILNPKGLIALHERDLIIAAVLLMLIIVIPVFILLFVFARKYRAGNQKATYAPNNYSVIAVIICWLFPSLIIFALALITWHSSFALDPAKPIISDKPPITIQVVALQWKWLFIYPEQNIATVNFIQVPVNTPIRFNLTADNSPMNSFWIPQLGGQIYAMTGMSTQLNLMATEDGDFAGSAAEVNGPGFAGMRFTIRSSEQVNFDQWVTSVKQSPNILNQEAYNTLLQPSENVLPNYYSAVEPSLYSAIIMKYMMPITSTSTASTTSVQEMDMIKM